MTLKNGHIIHVFAVLHVAVALCCRTAGISDEIWLTFLSVLMVTLICIRAKVGLELIVAAIILTNVTGYLLGVYGAKLMALSRNFSSLSMPYSMKSLMLSHFCSSCGLCSLNISSRRSATFLVI